MCFVSLFQVFAKPQPSTAPVSELEANFNKNNKNLFQGVTPIPKQVIDELKINSTLRDRYASEIYQNHLFVYHQWLQFWKLWVDTHNKEINKLTGSSDLEPTDNEDDAPTSLETDVSSGSVPQPAAEKIYPIYSDVDNEILFWMSEKRLNQYLNQSVQTPTTIMINPNFQINTVISNSTNATDGVVSPDINSTNSNDFVVNPSLIYSIFSNITNTTTQLVSPSQNASGSDNSISFFNSPTLTFNVVKKPDPPVTKNPSVTFPEPSTYDSTTPGQTTITVTINNGTEIDSTTPKHLTLPVIITPFPKQINISRCPDDDDNCTDSNFATGAPFTAIYTTEEPMSPCTDTTCLNSTGDPTDLEPTTDDSCWIIDGDNWLNSNCTGDDCFNGTVGIDLEEYNATNPGYIENNSSNPVGQISVDQLLNSSNFNNDDWIIESIFFNVTDEGSSDFCYCDELDEDDCDQYNTTTEGAMTNVTNLNRIAENKEDSKVLTVNVTTPKSTVDIAAYVSQNRENIKSFYDLSKADDDKLQKSLAPILEALETDSPDPVKPEDTEERYQEQTTFHSYEQCQFDNITHNASLLEQIDPKIFSIAEANLHKPPHEAKTQKIEEENSTSHSQQLDNYNFDLLKDSDTLTEDSDTLKEQAAFPNPNNDTSCDYILEDNPLVINQSIVATTESPEALYCRYSKELVEMREIMKKLRLIGLNFLDMGHLMLNSNAKYPILPKHSEESNKHKHIYPIETDK